jgi:uncharacterized protein YjbJ (UPF0337 family)
MNTILLQAGWNILKGKFKQNVALLTGDDLEFKEGKTEEFLGRIQKKTGEKRAAIRRTRRECEELRSQIDQFPQWLSISARPQRPCRIQRKEMCCAL